MANEALELLAGQVDETVPGVKVLGGVELVALLTSKNVRHEELVICSWVYQGIKSHTFLRRLVRA